MSENLDHAAQAVTYLLLKQIERNGHLDPLLDTFAPDELTETRRNIGEHLEREGKKW